MVGLKIVFFHIQIFSCFQIYVSSPAISSFAYMVLIDQYNFLFIRKLNDTNNIAAEHGNMKEAPKTYSLVIAMNTVLETLVG